MFFQTCTCIYAHDILRISQRKNERGRDEPPRMQHATHATCTGVDALTHTFSRHHNCLQLRILRNLLEALSKLYPKLCVHGIPLRGSVQLHVKHTWCRGTNEQRLEIIVHRADPSVCCGYRWTGDTCASPTGDERRAPSWGAIWEFELQVVRCGVRLHVCVLIGRYVPGL